MTLTIGFSPCPNDTFIFHGLVQALVDHCPPFAKPVLADVETLNEWAMAARLDVSKISFHALGHVLDDYVLLRAGSALGRGCGPLLVTRADQADMPLERMTVAIPGRLTTAAMLLRLFAPSCQRLVPMSFERIMGAVGEKQVDAGIIIHESRFTYHQHGLVCRQDLGSWWEDLTGYPIPLGGIVARRSLGREKILQIEECIRASVRLAFQWPEKCQAYIKKHAQELDDQVIHDHIRLYVNRFTQDLGEDGIEAVKEFINRGVRAGLFNRSNKKIVEEK